jgi:TMEM175 potassium channel family protein
MHAAITERLSQADAILLRLNLLLLLTVAFLPFPTLLVGEALRDPESERVFVTLFGLTLMSIRLLGFTMDAYCRREHLYSLVEADQDLRRDRRTLLPVLAAYVVAILVGLALPVLAVAVYFGLAVYLVVPFREVRGLLFPRR